MFSTKLPTTTTMVIPVQEEGISTNQEAVPATLFWGRRKVAVRWITPILTLVALEAPQEKPRKK